MQPELPAMFAPPCSRLTAATGIHESVVETAEHAAGRRGRSDG
jgi:hypothetical protein